jgi:ATP-binding cassette, subfamily C, bacterial
MNRYFRPLTGPAWARPIAFLYRMVRLHPYAAAMATAAAALLGLIEGVGLGLLLPLLALIGVPTGNGPSSATRRIEEGFHALGIPLSLGAVLGVFFAVGMLQIALTALQQYLVVRTAEQATLNLRQRLFEAASRAGWTVLAAGHGAYLVNAVVSESNRVGIVFGNCITAFGLIVSFAVYLALAAWLSWKFTLLTIGVGAASLVGLQWLYRSSRRFGAWTSAATNRMQQVLNEHVSAAKLIRAFGANEWSRETFRAAAVDVSRYLRRNQTNTVLVKAAVEPFGLIVLVGIVYLSVAIVHMPATELMLLLLIFYRITPRLVSLQEMLQRIHGILPNYDAVSKALERLEAAAERPGGRPFTGLASAIELRGVTVGHGDRVVLRDVSFSIPARKTIALIGTSGGGKTTLLDLLSGVLHPMAGQVLVDGVPMDKIDFTSYRQRLGIVPQDSVLFHDTVAANLRFAAPHASDEDLWAALAAAHADGFVRDSPKGLDTMAGDQGLRMSGGQRQRIALARALLRRPDLLLLDEPSSALDDETELAIRETFRRLRGQITIVLVSHRLALAEDADVAYLVAGGRVEQQTAIDAAERKRLAR